MVGVYRCMVFFLEFKGSGGNRYILIILMEYDRRCVGGMGIVLVYGGFIREEYKYFCINGVFIF